MGSLAAVVFSRTGPRVVLGHWGWFAMVGWGCIAGLVLALASAPAAAQARLDVRVLDGAGLPLAGAVVSLHGREDRADGPPAVAAPIADAVIEQVRGEFNPPVLVVTTGTPVRFPNLDRIRHHVYSFSPAKVFELPLYSGEAHEPVVFDVPGVVTLGCNIHDWMLGHVVVLDTAVHSISDGSGAVSLEAPRGTWHLRVWHARLPAGEPPQEREVTLEDGTSLVEVALELSRPLSRGRPGDTADGARR